MTKLDQILRVAAGGYIGRAREKIKLEGGDRDVAQRGIDALA
jgi:hypothetical protein